MNEQVINLLSKKWVIPAAVGVTSFGAGSVLGYILGKRNGDVFVLNESDLIDDTADVEVQPTLFDNLNPEILNSPIFSNAVMAVENAKANYFSEEAVDDIPWELEEEAELMIEEDELLEAVAEQTHFDQITNDGDTAPVIKNVFSGGSGTWDHEQELSLRSPDAPYVIHLDEWVADEAGCDQSTVTYYVGDDMMADPYDTPIYGYSSMMGELKFGHGSNDPSVVYIRNEKMEMEWEILLHTGRFDIEVLGHDIESAYEAKELKHSVPRFRDD